MCVPTRGGGYSTLVWVGVCRWDFLNATHSCTHFEGKVTHPCTKNQTFSLKFAPFWRKFRKIFKSWPIKVPNLRHFGANFRKFWKIDPSKYHVFEKKRDPLMYLAAWFCYPCLRHIPITTFVLSTPPGCAEFSIMPSHARTRTSKFRVPFIILRSFSMFRVTNVRRYRAPKPPGGGELRFELDRGVPLKPQNPYPSLRMILAKKGTHF